MPKRKVSSLDQRAADYVSERMPMLGYGSYQVRGESTLRPVIDMALSAGYRFFDTAQIYRNESVLGRLFAELLPQHGLSREDIFYTSKVSPANQGAGKAGKSVLKSLEQLQTGYIYLMLIHWPGSQRLRCENKENRRLRTETYFELEELIDEGKVRAIGVSNYEIRHLEELLDWCRILPAVNQCEFHPHFIINRELIDFCKSSGIHFQAYSSLGGPDYVEALLGAPEVKAVSKTHGTSPAVVLLAWAICQGHSVLPRSTRPERVAENIKALEVKLADDEVALLSSLPVSHRVCWNPETVA